MVRTFKLSSAHRASGLDFKGQLNPQQLAVATAPGGPMVVVAGAGTGKTRSLIYRLAWLLTQGVDPGGVLLMTFTNRAAREMVHRVQQLVPQDAMRIWAGTFHHIANRLLREKGAAIGLTADFTILDREDAADLIAACVVEANVNVHRRRFPSKSVLLSLHSQSANTLLPLAEVITRRHPTFSTCTEEITAVLELYDQRKRQRQLLDYDDLLGHWWTLLEQHPAVQATWADRFRHILVDEYQDTNAIQGRIVDRLAERHRNCCVVGDDAQSIYRFRGAEYDNLLRFEDRYPDARTFRLEHNYRSTPQILALANASIAVNQRRLPKQLHSSRPAGLRPALVPCADHLEQSRFIGEYILHLLDQGRGLNDIAVLYRSHWHAMEIQLELQRRDIPFQIRGGIRFFEQAHIKDMLAILRIKHNDRDELAWHRVLRLQPRIGGRLSMQIWQRLTGATQPRRVVGDPRVLAGLPEAVRAALRQLAALLDEIDAQRDPGAMIHCLLQRFYGDHLTSRYENAQGRRQDIEAVADFAGQYRTLESFLTDVALTGDFTGETCVDGPEEQAFVTLSTVHQAKGLEWPVVLIPWMADGRFPTDMAMGSDEDLEEERRVFHVAVTRAADELYLAVPLVWSNHRKQRILMKPSRFLTELNDANLVETMQLESQWGGGGKTEELEAGLWPASG